MADQSLQDECLRKIRNNRNLCETRVLCPWQPSGSQPSNLQNGSQPTNGQSCGQPSNGQSCGQPSNGQSCGQPSSGQSCGQPSNGQSCGQPSSGQSCGQPSNGQSCGQPSSGQSCGQPSNGQCCGQSSNGQSSGQPSNGQSSGQPSNGKSCGQPSNGQNAGQNLCQDCQSQILGDQGNQQSFVPNGNTQKMPSFVGQMNSSAPFSGMNQAPMQSPCPQGNGVQAQPLMPMPAPRISAVGGPPAPSNFTPVAYGPRPSKQPLVANSSPSPCGQNGKITSQMQFPGKMPSQNAFPGKITSQNAFPGKMTSQNAFPGKMTSQNAFPGKMTSQNAFPGKMTSQNAFPPQAQNFGPPQWGQNGQNQFYGTPPPQGQNFNQQNGIQFPPQSQCLNQTIQSQNGAPMQLQQFGPSPQLSPSQIGGQMPGYGPNPTGNNFNPGECTNANNTTQPNEGCACSNGKVQNQSNGGDQSIGGCCIANDANGGVPNGNPQGQPNGGCCNGNGPNQANAGDPNGYPQGQSDGLCGCDSNGKNQGNGGNECESCAAVFSQQGQGNINEPGMPDLNQMNGNFGCPNSNGQQLQINGNQNIPDLSPQWGGNAVQQPGFQDFSQQMPQGYASNIAQPQQQWNQSGGEDAQLQMCAEAAYRGNFGGYPQETPSPGFGGGPYMAGPNLPPSGQEIQTNPGLPQMSVCQNNQPLEMPADQGMTFSRTLSKRMSNIQTMPDPGAPMPRSCKPIKVKRKKQPVEENTNRSPCFVPPPPKPPCRSCKEED